MGVFYASAGVVHLTAPHPFLMIMPHWVPWPEAVIFWTGIAEFFGAAALVQGFFPSLRHLAGWALGTYCLCVWPANINHFVMDMARPDHGFGLAYHVPRMFAQPVLIWLSIWVSQAIDWPWARART